MAVALNTVIVDGQEYKPGDTIPDFKSIKCVDTREPRKYQGLSADVSVLNDIIARYASNGASCFMSDTGEYYEFNSEEKEWKLITNIAERGFDAEKAYGALKHMIDRGGVSDDKIKNVVTQYMIENPVQPGATTEQAQQIEQNKTDVASLKEETGSLREDLDYIINPRIISFKQTKSSNYQIKLYKGRKYEITISGEAEKSLYICQDILYNAKNAVQIFNVVASTTSFILEADVDYYSIRLYQSNNTECEIKIKEVQSCKASEVILSPTTLSNSIINGDGIDVIDTDSAVSTQIFEEKLLYLVIFPPQFSAKYNVREKINSDKRVTITAASPFCVKNIDTLRISFFRKDGTKFDKRLSWLGALIKIYKIKPSEYDVTIALKNTECAESATIEVDDNNTSSVLASIIGSYSSIRAFIYGGDYNLDTLYTVKTGCNSAMPFCDYNFSNGTKERRSITIVGEYNGSPQTENAVKFFVTQKLHSSFKNGESNFLIGGNYAQNEKIGRISTTINMKNINIIGYKYDKPITYIDTSKCLSTMLCNVNVRSWCEHLTEYVPFDETPNAECCGIRVGRGSNYGICNSLKHLNVWFCGKGIACNGEHYVFEDVKTHHCYIGWYFGDKATVGHFEHTNLMIGCSIEGCYRLMVLSKQGETVEQDYVQDVENNKLISTLDIIGLSTERIWRIPTNEVSEGVTKATTLPILEILKGAYHGKIDMESETEPFETGSGKKFLWIAWAPSGNDKTNYVKFPS